MTFELDEDFEWFLEEFGEPEKYEDATDSIIRAYTGKLPTQLFSYWQEYGFCRFKDGLFFTVNPQNYQTVIEAWLKEAGIEDIDKYYVIARSGFGDLFLWHESKGNIYTIEPRDSEVFYSSGCLSSKGLDDAMQGFFGTKSPKRIDLEDVDTNKLIFADAVKKFGPLAPDEMFTFEPALFLGGEQTSKTVNKVNLFVQLELLLKMGTPQVMDIHGLAKKAFS